MDIFPLILSLLTPLRQLFLHISYCTTPMYTTLINWEKSYPIEINLLQVPFLTIISHFYPINVIQSYHVVAIRSYVTRLELLFHLFCHACAQSISPPKLENHLIIY